MCFFFFSSRRRHTRWNCDWSSDVCSSDLARWAARAFLETSSSLSFWYCLRSEWPRITYRTENRSEEHTSELQSQFHLVCRLLLEKKKKTKKKNVTQQQK